MGLACLLSAASGSAEEKPYWPWGPLAREDALPLLDLEPVQWKEVVEDTDFSLSWISGGRAPAGDGVTELLLNRKEEGYFAEVRRGGKRLMPPTICAPSYPSIGGVYYSGNLNDDNRTDFLLGFWCGGVGLNATLNEFALILSSSDGYSVTRIETFDGRPDPHCVRVDGKPHYITKSFDGEPHCKDGKPHNFWIYNLFEIKGDSVYLANQNHPNFPKTIWYTFEPNSKETNMLTRVQKERILRNSATKLNLIGNRVPHSPEATDPERQ